jgi:lipoprotein-releasing system ATP-binding protein
MLTLSAIAREYPEGRLVRRVLDGVTLALAAGDAAVVAGGPATGKSTLLAIAGALEAPSAGQVHLDGVDPQRLSADERARLRGRDIGFVFAWPSLLPQLDLLDNVLLPTQAGEPDPDAVDRAHALLAAVGLETRARVRASALSPAERQRAALARAYLRSPRLVLCDDPTSGLDPADTAGFVDRLLRLHARHHAALMVTTRDAAPFASLARQWGLREGRLEPA